MKAISTSANNRTLANHEGRELRLCRAMPRTDYSFQEPADNVAIAAPPAKPRPRPELRAFRQMSQDLLAREDRRNYVIEMIVFGLVVALVAWPLVSLLIVLAQTARG